MVPNVGLVGSSIIGTGIPPGLVGPGALGDRFLLGEPPAPPVPPPPPKSSKIIHPGGNVLLAKLIYRVDPAYPPIARAARVSGTVILEATIDEDGNVAEVHVLDGHALLRDAAVQAVKQWKYSPTLLNGEPVQVIGSIKVVFTLR